MTELPCWTLEAPLLGWAMELGTQCKIKMCNSLFEKYQDFQDGNSTALNQVIPMYVTAPVLAPHSPWQFEHV